MAKRIYWRQWVVVTKFQARTRGYLARKRFDRLLVRHRARILMLSKASVQIQRMARGYLGRRRFERFEHQRELDKARRAQQKEWILQQGGGIKTLLRSTLRYVQPLRYAWEVYKCKKIQRVYRGYRARKRCKVLRLMQRFAEVKRKRDLHYNSATNIIRIYRGWVLRRYAQERIFGRKCTIIQCCWRQWLARKVTYLFPILEGYRNILLFLFIDFLLPLSPYLLYCSPHKPDIISLRLLLHPSGKNCSSLEESRHGGDEALFQTLHHSASMADCQRTRHQVSI